ncbi:TAXI family TRAP transporter solute-binding subunit [Desulfoferula mesophila]|uniref:C4-dicarboxylate ABC transporter n=1 Tax=Desulfoferula mesophila TaxID=3058419 RepID=A0AAU9EC74_9BACT|nr:C4-dicarboxylate ABC transporter [Desulfoferula mesophilus]
MRKPKIKLVGIVAVALLCLALGGQAMAADSGPQKLSMATFKSGSGWYIMAQTMAKIMLGTLPQGSTVDVLPYSGGVGNPMLLHKGKANIALGFPVETGQAIKGETPYKEKAPEIRMLVGNLDTYWYLFSVRGNVPITSFEELKTKKFPLRLVLLPKGSSGEWATKTVLKAYGITYEDIESWGGKVTFVSFPTAVEMMKDGQADAFAHVSTPGHPSWTQLSTLTKIRFLPMGAKVGAQLVGKYGYRMSTLPKGAFRGVEKPVQVLGFATLLMTTDKMPNDVAYKITKAICENRAELATTYKGAAAFRPQLAPDVPLPLHPGAEKYYKEAGYLK